MTRVRGFDVPFPDGCVLATSPRLVVEPRLRDLWVAISFAGIRFWPPGPDLVTAEDIHLSVAKVRADRESRAHQRRQVEAARLLVEGDEDGEPFPCRFDVEYANTAAPVTYDIQVPMQAFPVGARIREGHVLVTRVASLFGSWEPLPGPRRRSLGGLAPVFHLSLYGAIRGSLFTSCVELWPVSAAPSSEAELSDFTEFLARVLRAELHERQEPFDVKVELRQSAWPVRAAPNSEAELCDFTEFVARMLRAELRERQAPFAVAVEMRRPGIQLGREHEQREELGRGVPAFVWR